MIPIFNSVFNAISNPLRKCVKPLLVAGLTTSLLSGCSFLEPYKPTLTQGTVISHEAVSLLQEGLTKDQTRQLCGPPLGESPFNPNHWEYAFYTTDDSFHPDAIKRLTVEFDADGMIKTWKTSEEPIELKLD